MTKYMRMNIRKFYRMAKLLQHEKTIIKSRKKAIMIYHKVSCVKLKTYTIRI